MENSPELVADRPGREFSILNTSLLATTYDGLLNFLQSKRSDSLPLAIDFSNTHIVTMRRHEPAFARITSKFDYFVPDGMPLIWVMNALGANLKDRVYGPTFMKYALQHSSPEVRHYFLGGSPDCLQKLLTQVSSLNPSINIAGFHDGYFSKEQSASILQDVLSSKANFIWVGLGTPKQQAWIDENKSHFKSGILLAVGFAFDVNARTKHDAPLLLQNLGLTWCYRILCEPRRLLGRYVKYNTLFLYYLLQATFGTKQQSA